ncbi:DUF4394 domain-containing protein [Streptomyces clavifer]|uniref:DUF4394 domain-containing protein n=1 Tax=Streptomyces clavifer TaxID=68188 RepID=UPI002E80470B|nr:DUF4394 domain-containing protein [Streptomyces clavifer]WUC25877.1 DUF4394 domain-containing protein [Streptomyces clavifer]WUC31935.1 DUF4394 domain-containing protein [Streptomyces clavifer]
MRTRLLSAAAAGVIAASLAAPALASAGAEPTPFGPRGRATAPGLVSVGLTSDQRLVGFRVTDPGDSWSFGKVSGLSADRKLVGIDFRVQNGKLYGVGDRGGVYTVNSDAQAVKVSQLTVALAGENFGVDFNPAANRLRVISDTGQNLRHNIDDPAAPRTTTPDGTLTNPTTPPSTALGVTGAAYTNNDLDVDTATTLFDIDTVNDRISLQSPANAGTLAPTGNLGANAGPQAGFDIYYKPSDGSNRGFATLNTGGKQRFYQVSILDGETSLVGAFPAGRQVVDIALPLNQN